MSYMNLTHFFKAVSCCVSVKAVSVLLGHLFNKIRKKCARDRIMIQVRKKCYRNTSKRNTVKSSTGSSCPLSEDDLQLQKLHILRINNWHPVFLRERKATYILRGFMIVIICTRRWTHMLRVKWAIFKYLDPRYIASIFSRVSAC